MLAASISCRDILKAAAKARSHRHIVMISGMWAPVFELTHTNAVADLLMLINSETEDMDVVTSISLSNLFRYNRKWL